MRHLTVIGLVLALFMNYVFGTASYVGAALLNMAVFGAVISYTMQGLSFYMLRRDFPNIDRPYVSPLGNAGAVACMAWSARALSASLPFWPPGTEAAASIWTVFQVDFARGLYAILPAPILWGASFALALAAAGDRDDTGETVGRVYAANTVGAILGALVTSLVLVEWFGSQRAEQAMIALGVLGGAVLLLPGRASLAVRSSAVLAAFCLPSLAAWLRARSARRRRRPPAP